MLERCEAALVQLCVSFGSVMMLVLMQTRQRVVQHSNDV